MKKIFLAGVILLMAARSMAFTFPFSIYALNVSSLSTALNAPPVAGGTNYVAIMNGVSNFVVAPVSLSNPTSTPLITNTTGGSYFTPYSSLCPIYCDINSLLGQMGNSQTVSYQSISGDLTNFYKGNPGSYNCILLNNTYVGKYVNGGSSVVTVCVFVWATNGGGNLYSYVGLDANNKLVTNYQFSDNTAKAYQISIN